MPRRSRSRTPRRVAGGVRVGRRSCSLSPSKTTLRRQRGRNFALDHDVMGQAQVRFLQEAEEGLPPRARSASLSRPNAASEVPLRAFAELLQELGTEKATRLLTEHLKSPEEDSERKLESLDTKAFWQRLGLAVLGDLAKAQSELQDRQLSSLQTCHQRATQALIVAEASIKYWSDEAKLDGRRPLAPAWTSGNRYSRFARREWQLQWTSPLDRDESVRLTFFSTCSVGASVKLAYSIRNASNGAFEKSEVEIGAEAAGVLDAARTASLV